MKSFEQFEYDESLISEIVNVDVSQRFKTTSSARSTTTGARSPGGQFGNNTPSIFSNTFVLSKINLEKHTLELDNPHLHNLDILCHVF